MERGDALAQLRQTVGEAELVRAVHVEVSPGGEQVQRATVLAADQLEQAVAAGHRLQAIENENRSESSSSGDSLHHIQLGRVVECPSQVFAMSRRTKEHTAVKFFESSSTSRSSRYR